MFCVAWKKGGEHEMKRIQQLAGGALALLYPMMAAAAVVDSGFFATIRGIINAIIIILFALVTMYFIWGVVKYVMASGDEKAVETGKNHMIWGIVGMAVMAGAWGIVQLVLNAAGVSSGAGPGQVPQF
jgi:hypothetical protein